MSYNRRKILHALSIHGVTILREGGNHTVLRSQIGKQSTLGRHAEVDRITTRKIVKQLGLDWKSIEKDLT
jgi:hypothetical protein